MFRVASVALCAVAVAGCSAAPACPPGCDCARLNAGGIATRGRSCFAPDDQCNAPFTATCADGLVCVTTLTIDGTEGVCLPPMNRLVDEACASDDECAAGLVCNGGACEQPPPYCDGPAPTPTTSKCSDDPCGAVPASHSLGFSGEAGGAAGAFVDGDGAQIYAGISRADVEDALGPGVRDEHGTGAEYYCDFGLKIRYATVPLFGPQPADKAAVVSSLDNIHATAGCSLVVGQPAAGTPKFVHAARDGRTIQFFTDTGLLAIVAPDGVITELDAVHSDSSDFAALPVKLDAGIGTIDITTPESDDVLDVLGRRGLPPQLVDVDGATFSLLAYPQFGIEIANRCADDACTAASQISIGLSFPFAGVDAHGVGVGSTRDDVEAELGAGAPADAHGFIVYTANLAAPVGVVYAHGFDCEDRVELLVIGYDESSSGVLFTK